MLLYELAIVLDKRSPELLGAAAELGMGELQAATDLDPEQVARLRAHFGGATAPPPLAPLGSGAPPLPAPPSGPLAAEPLVFGAPPPPLSGGGPTAPESWGPPVAPSSWGPPPGAMPPAPESPEPGHVGPYFAAPETATAEVVDSPLGLGEATLPPPPPPSSAGDLAAAGAGGMGTGQKLMIGGAVVAVAALFGFMAVNTGPDEARERALAAKEAQIDAELDTTTVPAPTTTAPTTTAAPSQDAYAPVDVARFCQGGLAIATFELRLAAAIADADFPELSGLVRDRRAGWSGDVTTMASGAAPILVNDIDLYRSGYDRFFDAVTSSSSLDEAYGKIDRLALARSSNAAQEVGAQVEFECQ